MRVKLIKAVSGKVILMLCIASFLGGSLFTTIRTSIHSSLLHNKDADDELTTIANDFDHKIELVEGSSSSGDIMREVTKTHQAIQSLDKTISTLEMELAAVGRTRRLGSQLSSSEKESNRTHQNQIQKAFVVIGINTAFSSKRRRDSIRQTWMPTGEKLRKLEEEKGIIIRFVIGYSATPGGGAGGGVLDGAIDEEEVEYNDFLRLNHVEAYHRLSTKTRLYFSTALSIWDAQFYVKVDDDVHVNLGMLASTLAQYRSKPRIYIGCMKSGPVHSRMPILHRYANEDVSLGSWFIGLEVEHVDHRSMCCGSPPDCEWKAEAGNVCVASFDWSCSGICKSAERMKNVHNTCGEGDGVVWNVSL
ncbi:probable beta-1,3-galactosyltransferase 8 isoform X2 [Camellia sinensis]|uniref:probable beta-1,3-galactosyltransferase 8 isoform X2 n=1 Tax=Camellia sinensis TaxID=4442 RepID=UPI00103580AC|nr:probable beta-1,3-galactosyltransferase 8 isoform X2 [Camellia sinensis]